MSREQVPLTAGQLPAQEELEEEEEEKEVDPSIVGSLDNVYKDEPGILKEEDPFKKVPMMDDHEKPSSMMAMEKSVDAMVALVEHTPGSPLPEDCTSLDKELRQNENTDHLPNLGEEVATDSSVPLDLAAGARRPADMLHEAGNGVEIAPASQPVDLSKGLGLTLTSPS